MKPIKLTPAKWAHLKTRLEKDYSPSVTKIRWKMKEVLGFTTRDHQEFIRYWDHSTPAQRANGDHGYKDSVYLDFFDDAKRTLFMLKYSEYFDGARD